MKPEKRPVWRPNFGNLFPGQTQEEVARKLNTKRSAISRMENHAQDIRLSTLGKYAKAIGRKLHFSVG